MPVHNAILQRLDSSLLNDGIATKYPADVFSSVNFDGVPVVFCESGPHPEHDMVSSGTLPDGYRVVGRVNHTRVSNYGEPRLIADLALDDEQVSARASAGELSISTAMDAHFTPTGEGRAIAHPVVPNHVLIFPRGPGQVPNDAGAYIVNLRAPETEIANKLKELPPSESVKMTETNTNLTKPEAPITASAEQINNLTAPTAAEVMTSIEPDLHDIKKGEPAKVKRELEDMSDKDLEAAIAEAKAIIARSESILAARRASGVGGVGVANLRAETESLKIENQKLKAELVRLRNSAPSMPAEGYTVQPSEAAEDADMPQRQRTPFGFSFSENSTFIGSGHGRSADPQQIARR